MARNNRHAISIAQHIDVGQRLFTCLPNAIHPLQGTANRYAIRFVIGQNSVATVGNFIMKTNGFGIEASQSNRIAQIIQEESCLLWDFIERERLDAQVGTLRCALTGSFGDGQFGVAPAASFYASEVSSASKRVRSPTVREGYFHHGILCW